MAAPAFSPIGGVGSTYIDPNTGMTYVFQGGTTWTPITQIGQPSVDTTGGTGTNTQTQQILDAIASLTKGITTSPTPPAPTQPKIDLSGVQLPLDLNQYMTQAASDPGLKQYYSQLLTEAKGDVNEAMRIMEYDYQTGGQRIRQLATQNTQRTMEDLTSALQTLGLSFGQEKQGLLDTLNKRGIGLTQSGGAGSAGTKVAGAGTVTYDDKGNPIYSGQEGQAGTELSQLSEDQRLRREAQLRTSQRALQDIQTKQTQGLQDVGETATEATYKAKRGGQTAQEQIQQQQEQDITQRAQMLQQSALQKAGLQLQEAQLKSSGGNLPSGYQLPA